MKGTTLQAARRLKRFDIAAISRITALLFTGIEFENTA